MICFDKNCRICECIEKNAKSYLGQFTFLKIFKILTLKSIKKGNRSKKSCLSKNIDHHPFLSQIPTILLMDFIAELNSDRYFTQNRFFKGALRFYPDFGFFGKKYDQKVFLFLETSTWVTEVL